MYTRDAFDRLRADLKDVYAALVLWLLVRLIRHQREGAPRCPACGRPLVGLSERVAAATGQCDSCGGQVLADAAVP